MNQPFVPPWMQQSQPAGEVQESQGPICPMCDGELEPGEEVVEIYHGVMTISKKSGRAVVEEFAQSGTKGLDPIRLHPGMCLAAFIVDNIDDSFIETIMEGYEEQYCAGCDAKLNGRKDPF
jgi:hypothetical protein